jgi:hypothetical protein
MTVQKPAMPQLHAVEHLQDGNDRLPGAELLIGADEGDSAETVSSTSLTILKTMALPPNNFRLILAEAEICNRFEQDVASRCVFSWYLVWGGTTLKTFLMRLIAQSTAGIDSGDRTTHHISTIFAGYQTQYQNVYLKGCMMLNNANVGIKAHIMRLWGIV